MDNTDTVVFAAGIFVTFIFDLGVYVWTRVYFAKVLSRNEASQETSERN